MIFLTALEFSVLEWFGPIVCGSGGTSWKEHVEQSHLTKHQEEKEVEEDGDYIRPHDSGSPFLGCFYPWPPKIGEQAFNNTLAFGGHPGLNSFINFETRVCTGLPAADLQC